MRVDFRDPVASSGDGCQEGGFRLGTWIVCIPSGLIARFRKWKIFRCLRHPSKHRRSAWLERPLNGEVACRMMILASHLRIPHIQRRRSSLLKQLPGAVSTAHSQSVSHGEMKMHTRLRCGKQCSLYARYSSSLGREKR